MGKNKFNVKGRKIVDTIIDESETKKIKLDSTIDIQNEYGGYDKSNPLVLPSKKRSTKIKKENVTITRILSKKKRKALEKIVDKKRKKENRKGLLHNLMSVQLPSEELDQYTSIISVQTKGIKKKLKKVRPGNLYRKLQTQNQSTNKCKSSIAGGAKKKRIALLNGYIDPDDSDTENNKKQRNLNHIGVDDPTSSSEDSTEDDGSDDGEPETNATKEAEKLCNDGDVDKNSEQLEEHTPVRVSETVKVEEKKSLENEKIAKIEIKPIIKKPTVYIHVERNAEIQAARLKLPILCEEQTIMEVINENQIIIVAGETGSGKTTQVPQFLYEAGYAAKKMIAVTEPRRVAAISMSKRVATEMNLSTSIVSYLIRFEGNATANTKIKFMTDGVLLKEIETDFVLTKYSVIILDEAHERSIFTDILIGLLSRIVPLRNKRGDPLKLIIMSATLRISDFTDNRKLFKNVPPVLTVETRQFPVTVHFNKRTNEDYVKEAYNKILKIHCKLPDGGILIFLTGQQEVNYVVRKLRKAFPYKHQMEKTGNKINDKAKGKVAVKDENKNKTNEAENENDNNADDDDDDDDDFDLIKAIKHSRRHANSNVIKALPVINLDDYKLPMDDAESDLFDETHIKEDDDDDVDIVDDDSDLDSDMDDTLNVEGLKVRQPLWVLPLYSILSSEKQARVFQAPPDGTRLCVVSTNIAETSITIPNVKYVVDCGRQKTRLYDKITGVTSYEITYCSKASANQRAGRAGRTSAGHCYRLYSSAVYNDEFQDFAQPDIQKKPVEDLMLQMKCMGIDKVVNFPFPSPPDRIQLEMAEHKLKLLGALENYEIMKVQQPTPSPLPSQKTAVPSSSIVTKVTSLGHAISAFPVSPKYGKMLALSHQSNLLPYTVCMVAALSVPEVLIEAKLYSAADDDDDNDNGNANDKDGTAKRTNPNRKWLQLREKWVSKPGHNSFCLGDPAVLLRAVGAAEYANTKNLLQEFCTENGLRLKAITEIRKLRCQLTNEINLSIPNIDLCVDPNMKPPSDLQSKLLRQILLSGMMDQVARKMNVNDLAVNVDDRIKLKYAYQCADIEEPIFMHSSCVLRKEKPLPEWVIYQEIYEIQSGDTRKMYMRGITAIEPEWLLIYAHKLCNIRQIKEEPAPKYNDVDGKLYCYAEATYGRSGWELPLTEIEMQSSELTSRYFTMYFLDGVMFPTLLNYKKYYRSDPKNVVKSWARNVSHILTLVNAINKRQINSKEKIIEIWKTEPNYLLPEFCEFVDKLDTNEIFKIWPPI